MAVGAFAVGCMLALLPAAGHDQFWCLYVAGRMLDGVHLYGPQIFESNPPLIMWLSEVPVALAHALHVESSLAAKLLVMLALAATYLLTLTCLRCVYRKEEASRITNTFAATLAMFCALAYLCVPARDFGQREHLLSFLVLPYLALAALAGEQRTTLRVAAGTMAAAGICLKPQQALLPLAVEVLLLARARSLRPLRRQEPWLLLGLAALYLLAIRLLTPEYLTQTLPILRETYWAIGHLTFPVLLRESWQTQALGCICVALLSRGSIRAGLSPAGRNLACVALAAGTGADLAYMQQGTGWYYQQLPALVCFLAALTIVLCEAAGRAAWRRDPLYRRAAALRWPAVAVAALAAFLTLHFSRYPLTRERAFAITSPDPSLFRNLQPGTPVAVLTTSVDEAMMPVAAYHLFWAQRTNNLWWMPAILRAERAELQGRPLLRPSRLRDLEALQRHNTAEDLQRWWPVLLLVERCQDPAVRCQVIEDLSPNLLAWFRQDDGFRQAFSAYRFEKTDGRFDVYRRRITAPSGIS